MFWVLVGEEAAGVDEAVSVFDPPHDTRAILLAASNNRKRIEEEHSTPYSTSADFSRGSQGIPVLTVRTVRYTT
jgi:hypothetical protein